MGRETIAGYELAERLSIRGAVDTWRGSDTAGASVVVRRYPATDVVAFTSRASALSRLAVPNVAVLRARGKSGDRLFTVRDFHPAGSLRQLASSLEPSARLGLCAEIGRALEQAHVRGLVHGAVKPENVLFDDGRRGYLADFHIGDASGGEFSPPEPATDPRSDQWSLAALAVFLIAGRVPSPGATIHADPALDAALRRALSPSPADRFRRIDELASALESAAGRALGEELTVRIERRDTALRVHVAGGWTPSKVDAFVRDLDQAMTRFPGIRAIGYVLEIKGGNQSQAIEGLGNLHLRHRKQLQRVGFVSHSPQTRGACILIGTRGGLEWKTFAGAEAMDAWLGGGAS